MLLIEANDKKAYSDSEGPPKEKKKKKDWWHQDSAVTIPCLRAGRIAYQQRRGTKR